MKYAELKEMMAEFHAGTIEREDIVAAFALWQRPVECAPENMKKSAIEAIIHA